MNKTGKPESLVDSLKRFVEEKGTDYTPSKATRGKKSPGKKPDDRAERERFQEALKRLGVPGKPGSGIPPEESRRPSGAAPDGTPRDTRPRDGRERKSAKAADPRTAPTEAIDLTHYFNLLRLNWVLVLAFVTLGLLASLAFTRFVTKPVFESSIDILIKPITDVSEEVTAFDEIKRGTIESILNKKVAPQVRREILDRYADIRKDVPLFTTSRVNIEDDIINLRIQSTVGEHLPEVTYKMADYLVQADIDMLNETAKTSREYLETRFLEEGATLEEAEVKVRDYLKKDPIIREHLTPDGITDWDYFRKTLLDRINQFDDELQKAEIELDVAKVLREDYQTRIAEEPDVVPGDKFVLNPVTEKLIEFELELIDAQSIYTEDAERIIDLKEQIANLRASEQSEIDTLVTRQTEQVNPLKRQAMIDLMKTEYNIGTYRERIDKYEQKLEELALKAGHLAQVEGRYKTLKENADAVRRDYEATATRIREVAIQENKKLTHYKILVDQDELDKNLADAEKTGTERNEVYRSVVGARQISPRPFLNAVLGILIGLFSAVAIIYAGETMEQRLRSPREIRRHLGLKTLGVIVKQKKELTILDAEHNIMPFAEAFRVLNNSIYYAFPTERRKVLLVTSSAKGEGKTVTAVNLAIANAMNAKKTVLVDADLRSGNTRKHILKFVKGPQPSLGLSTVLEGKAAIDDIIVRTNIPGLDWVPSGPYMDNPSKYMSADPGDDFINNLADKYEVVIIDITPVLPVVDATILAPRADGVLMVTGFRSIRWQFALEAVERLLHVNAPVIGAVITKTPRKMPYVSTYGYTYYHKLYR